MEHTLWAADVAQNTLLPDARLNQRLAQILHTYASQPTVSIPQACDDWAATKATYRFLGNPRVTDDLLLDGVCRTTALACLDQTVLLLVQDTTSLNFTTSCPVAELGPIDSQNLARGIHVHSCLAFTESGEMLGLLSLQRWVRPKTGEAKPDQKESYKWIAGLDEARAALGEASSGAPLPRLIHIMDREGDCQDVMQAIEDAGDSAIIRCVQNRLVEGPIRRAHEAVREQPLLGRDWVEVPRRPGEAKRTAVVEVRSLKVTLKPNHEKYPHAWPMEWSLVEVWEADSPPETEALHWLLWTKEPAATVEEALEVVRNYRKRWPVEEYHLTLKSGCRIEGLQMESWGALQNALVLYAAVATRIVQLRDKSRREPEIDARKMLGEDECEVLRARCDPKKKVKGTLTLRQAVLWIGRLGGHLNRKGDGMPGVRTLWKGLSALDSMVQGYRLARRLLR
jgi:Transposase DNA-binding/Transposase Tn5 dimerisation domain